MMHVIKVVNMLVHIQSMARQRWSLRPTLDLDSDNFRRFNHRDELDSALQLPTAADFSDWALHGMHARCVLYNIIAQG
jgi:hypothetical protein